MDELQSLAVNLAAMDAFPTVLLAIVIICTVILIWRITHETR